MPYFTQEEVIKVGAYMRLSREDEGANKESNSIATESSDHGLRKQTRHDAGG